MELKDFISTALIEICEGIALAKSEVKNCAIAPTTITSPAVTNTRDTTRSITEVEKVSFEICVTVEDSSASQKGKGIGILKVVSANINSQQQENQKNININKISFSVPFVPAVIEL